MHRLSAISAALWLVLVPVLASPAPPVFELENPAVTGAATGYFHLQVIGRRWWFVAPDGNTFFPRAVALLDFASSGAAGTNFRAYDAVALRPAGSPIYRLATASAEDSNPSDVLMPGRPYTLRAAGDTLIIGSSRFRPEFTKFQMSVLGKGGRLAWYYYSNSPSSCGLSPPCWVLINGDGAPYGADTVGSAKGFNLDTNSSAYQSRMVNASGFITALHAPAASTHGAAGRTRFTYYAMPRDRRGNQIGNVSPAVTITNGSAVLNSLNYNNITLPRFYPMVFSWDVLKGDPAHFLGSVAPGSSLADHGQALTAYSITTGANRAQWWNWSVACPGNGSCTWPRGFVRLAIPGIDTTPRYYVKGVVEKTFTTAPVVSQIVEQESQDEILKARYGGSSAVTARIKWLNNDLPKLAAAGINAAGQYSYSVYQVELGIYNRGAPYAGDGAIRVKQPVPVEYIMPLSGWTMRRRNAFQPALAASPLKNIYANVRHSFCPGYEGETPDVFDPNFYRDVRDALDFGTGRGAWANDGNVPPDSSRVYAVLSEEADDLFGVNARSHEHLGAAVLMANPHMRGDLRNAVTYRDPVLYSKLKLRDMLKAKYRTLAALNAAWGTNYTSWGTSSGRVADGTNAYGAGSGFLDEDGRHIIADCRDDDYRHRFTVKSAIQSDLDGFVYAWSAHYAQVLRRAWSTLPDAGHLPPLFVPLYTGVDEAYRAMSPYVDGFWISPGEPAARNSFASSGARRELRRILRDTRRPLIVADYFADNSQEPGFDGAVSAVTYDPANGRSTITLTNAPYRFGAAAELRLLRSGCANSRPELLSVWWNQPAHRTRIVVEGNFASCLMANGTAHVRRARDGAGVYDDASQRASASITRFEAVINAAGAEGLKQVAGLELWGLYPEAPVSAGTPRGFGLMTYQDNPRDGRSDTSAAGHDRNGYPIGGEEGDYGNLLSGPGSLGAFLAGIDGRLK